MESTSINIVRTAGGLFVDFVVLHFVCLLFCVLGNGDGPLYNWPGVALCRWGGCRVVLCPAAVPIAQGGRGLFLW